jgi:cell surface protein
MKRYFAVVSMMCLFALAGITGAVAQEVQTANPATDFKYDLTKDGEGLYIYDYTGTATEVVIPAVIEDFPVVAISVEAFKGTNVISVVFPNSIRRIGDSCFEGCSYLQKVVLPKNLNNIPGKMFASCKALKQITLPNSIEIIQDRAFAWSGLESITIPDSVIVIDYNWYGAFECCEHLKTVNIGKGIKSIRHHAFKGCSSLTTVNIGAEKLEAGSYINVQETSYETGYGNDVFSGCSSLSLKEKKKIRDTGYTGGF